MVELQGKSNLKLEIHKRVDFHDLHWDCVRERLAARTKSSGLAVDPLIDQFINRFFSNLKAGWLASAELAQGDNLVAAALCECHGCDEITIERSTKIFIGVGNIPIFQSLRFRALTVNSNSQVSNKAGISARLNSGLVKIGPKRFSAVIRSYNNLLLFSGFCVVIGGLFYALAALLVLHALAVFMHFLSAPGDVTIVATRRADIGIALLSFLVGLAALLGGLVKKLFKMMRKRR